MVGKMLSRYLPLPILLVGLLAAGCRETITPERVEPTPTPTATATPIPQPVATEEGLGKRAEDYYKAFADKRWLQMHQFYSPRFREICKSADYAAQMGLGMVLGGAFLGFTPDSKWTFTITHITVNGEEGRVFVDVLIDGIPFESGGESSGQRWVFVDGQWWGEDTDWETGCDSNIFGSTAPSARATPTLTGATATQTPAPIGYSRRNPAVPGTPLSSGGPSGAVGHSLRLTVSEVVRGPDALERLRAWNQFNGAPPAGSEYLLAWVKMEYLTGPSADTLIEISTDRLTVVTSDGREMQKPLYCSGVDPEYGGRLYPGGSLEGWACLYVPVADQQPLLTYARNSDGSGGLWWRLGW
ncbi:MAG: hypothetical protein V1724_02485 [Chloroflexota bacterium]